jgi:3-oxoacyl-[acyl-carrier protein] reductase
MADIARVVIVTGAASGIGAATARRLAGPDTALLLHTRGNRTGLDAIAAEAASRGAQVDTVLGDLADPATPAQLVNAARKTFGRVDQIVSNAGQAKRGGFGDTGIDDIERAFAAMPIAFARLIDSALPDLRQSGWGRVVAVSSFVAHNFGTAGLLFASTAAAKAALEALAGTLAFQLAADHTTVNCVAPGFTRKTAGGHSAAPSSETRSPGYAATPSGRIAEPEDIAATIAFLLSRDAGHITGQTIHVDGGLLLP